MNLNQIRIRLRAAWSVLRGRPTAYRMSFKGGDPFHGPGIVGGYVAQCKFDGRR